MREPEGQPALLYIDLHLVHEVTSPQAFDGLRANGRPVRRPDLTLATVDHNVPTTDRSLPIGDPIAARQIEALRRLEIPEDMQKRYGFQPLGPADGPIKSAIFGGNNARLYSYQPPARAELGSDKLAVYKELYERHGAGRTNLAYGFVSKPA